MQHLLAVQVCYCDDNVCWFMLGVCLSMSVCVQVDPTGSGRVGAADAALFLKRSGLADLVLGKVRKDTHLSTEATPQGCLT